MAGLGEVVNQTDGSLRRMRPWSLRLQISGRQFRLSSKLSGYQRLKDQRGGCVLSFALTCSYRVLLSMAGGCTASPRHVSSFSGSPEVATKYICTQPESACAKETQVKEPPEFYEANTGVAEIERKESADHIAQKGSLQTIYHSSIISSRMKFCLCLSTC